MESQEKFTLIKEFKEFPKKYEFKMITCGPKFPKIDCQKKRVQVRSKTIT